MSLRNILFPSIVATIVWSQQTQAQENNIQRVDIKAKSEKENASKDAVSKTVIANAELTRFGDVSFTDAMKRVPGIIVDQGNIQLVGLNGKHTQILIDGEMPRGLGVAGLSLKMVEYVEIYNLVTAEFSTQGIGGTINIVLKKIPKTAKQEMSATVGRSDGSSADLEWQVADKLGDLSYSIYVSADDANSNAEAQRISTIVFNPQGSNIQSYENLNGKRSHTQGIRFLPKFQYKSADGWNIRFTSGLNFNRLTYQSADAYTYFSGARLPIEILDFNVNSHVRSANASLNISNKILRDIGLIFTFGLGGVEFNDSTKNHNFGSEKLVVLDRSTTRKRFSNTVDSSLKLTIPTNDEHNIVGGVSASTRSVNNTQFQLDKLPDQTTTLSDLGTHASIDKYALFMQDEWRFRKASSAYFGLRWEGVRLQSEGAQQLVAQNVSGVWSPIVQTLWQLNPERTDRLRFGIARTYQAPLDTTLITPKFYRPNNTIANPNIIGNSALKPELAWSIEAAYEHDREDSWSYSVRTIIRKIEDIQRQEIRYFDNAWWAQPVNAGRGISKRIDFNTTLPLKRRFENSPDIDFRFYLSKNWSSVSYLPKPDNLLTPITLNINASADYKATDIPLNLGISLRYRDGNSILLNSTKREVSHAQKDLDIYAGWKFANKAQLKLSIDNLLMPVKQTQAYYFDLDSTTIQNNRNRSYRSLSLKYETTL